jgi:hypothetical protein
MATLEEKIQQIMLGHYYTLRHTIVHYNKNLIYVFLEKKLRCLSPNIHIHVSLSDLYIPMIGPPIFLQQNRQTDRGNILIAHRHI